MERQDNLIILRAGRKRPGEKASTKAGFTIPVWLLKLIDEEAIEKGYTRANVMNYLLFVGLKAHVGEFKLPADNTINKNYIKRGRKWF